MSQTEVQLIKADAVQTADIANSAVTDAKISALTSSKLTGALPAISGASLTNLPASGKAKNLIINGAMKIAQRGTSSNLEGIHTVDRFRLGTAGVDEHPTQAQVDVASGTTPYTLGFRKAFKITNGNQTGGAGTSDDILINNKLEAQDIANSGWNYLSSSSNISLSFWVKSSVAQNFYGYLLTKDGSAYLYPFETGSLSADTWTKITKTIPGNSNLTFNNDTGAGLELVFAQFLGTDKTGSVSLNAWGAYNTSVRVPDMTSTWYTTNDATFELTGVQLEVGDSATDFEHKPFAEEMISCERYFQTSFETGQAPTNGVAKCIYKDGRPYSSSYISGFGAEYRTEMRATPSVTFYTSDNGNSSTANTVSGYNGSSWSAYSANLQSSSNAKKLTMDGNWHSGIVLYQFNYKAEAEL